MKAAVYEKFCGPIAIREVPDLKRSDDGIVLRVKATGICLSDWHGWRGNDPVSGQRAPRSEDNRLSLRKSDKGYQRKGQN